MAAPAPINDHARASASAAGPGSRWLTSRLHEATLAFGLLTRLPVPAIGASKSSAATWATVPVARQVWAFPIVGLLVGCLTALVLWLALRAGLPPGLSAVMALAASALLTGCLHEDGLADFADGIGGGRTRERKLEIMRDSRLGTYGAVALLLVIAARWSALATLSASPTVATSALLGCHILARGLLVLPLALLLPARSDGLGAGSGEPGAVVSLVTLALTLVLCLALQPMRLAAAEAVAAVLAIAAVSTIARAQVGGQTGDVLGAAEQLAETAALIAAVAFAR